MISYAQNFEDVLLERIFKNLDSGFYIDIGAQDPILDSVSLHFYDKGWTGIDVEPVPMFADALRLHRKRNCIIQKAITDTAEPIEMCFIPGTGLSTISNCLNDKCVKAGRESIPIIVETMSLGDLLNSAMVDNIHWLKIDVEGFEENCLSSWHDSQVRPWVVVVEATSPNTQIPTYEQWEHHLIDRQYVYVYGDGLNRFYLHDEHLELKEIFRFPPNIFDDFELSGTASQPFTRLINGKIDRLHNKTQDLHSQIDGLHNKNQDLYSQIDVLYNENQDLYSQIDGLQNENQGLHSQIGELYNKNDNLAIKVREIDALYNIERAKMFNMNGHVFHMKVVAIKFWILQKTRRFPNFQNQLRLLSRYGLKTRMRHAIIRLGLRRKEPIELSLIGGHVVKLTKPNPHDVYLQEIIKNKIRNHENIV
jgi:FkbM family methyltransferase